MGMPGLTMLAMFDHLVEWFIPPAIAADKDRRRQARMFLISHLLGPFIGNTVPLALYIFDPRPGFDVVVLAASITGFWIFPPVLRATARYELLALISIQNLIFCILWSCYFYGGVMSPTLPWVLTIPLLAFFYVGDSAPMRLAVLTMFGVNFAIFCGLYAFVHAPQPSITAAAMQGLGLISTIAAALYVTMMAVYYARALASQMELEALMRGHMETAAELRRAAAEAERASIAKAEFLAKMSHELRTPLNAVIGYSQILIETAEEEQDMESYEDLQKIHGAGHHLLQIVNDVLDLSKIEAGRMDLYIEEIEIETIVAATVDELRGYAVKNGNELRYTVDGSIGLMAGDAMKIKSALKQIVDNAIKYTKNGLVDIHCVGVWRDGRNMVEIRVHDTGIGIADQYLPTLFEQFAVGDDQTSTKYGGTGLGLALARKFCRLMGGDVLVETELGRGSCFTLLLPFGPEPEDGQDAPSGADHRDAHPAAAAPGPQQAFGELAHA
jgi:signal transduction histidine kinase